MSSFEDKKTFLELGIAFARFSAKPDEVEHEIISKVASQLDLEIPDYDELLAERITSGGTVGPSREWFEGPDGEARRNYGRIGTLSFAIFLLAQGNHDISDEAVQELRALFRAETIPADCLNDYLTELKTGDAAGAFRGFLATFSTALRSTDRADEQIFDNLGSPPSDFDDDVLEALQLTINEASLCYKQECYLATIVLCGKIIETVLKNAYRVVFKRKPVTKRGKDMNFADIRRELREENILIGEATDTQLQFIYQLRNAAVHGNARIPTKDEAKGTAILTQDVTNRIYQYFNDLADSSETSPSSD